MKPPEEDPFRYCIYCNADCYEDEPDHALECPSSTGVYPVDENTLRPYCPHCGESIGGAPRCMDCGAQLQVGDHFMHREVEAGDPLIPGVAGAAIFEVICLGCKAKDELA